MDDVIARHEHIVLQCSGGRDSMASLYRMRPWWNRITVLWCNTGAQYPEMVALMETVCDMVPRFLEVATDQPASLVAYGHPSDVVPIDDTAFGKILSDDKGIVIRDTWSCCAENIWSPMMAATKALGATLIIRGQRNDDRIKAPLRTGTVIEGIEYLLPVQDWTRAQCEAYLANEGFALPAHYTLDHSSLDCWSCTGYADKSLDRALYTRERHPEKFEQYIKLVGAIASRVEEQFKPMRQIVAFGKE